MLAIHLALCYTHSALWRGVQSLPCMSRLTNLDLYGDTWERMHLSLGDIAFLQYLTKVQHLGFHHYELEDDASQYMGGRPAYAQEISLDLASPS